MAIYRGDFIIVEEYGTEDPHKVYRDLIDIFAAGHAKRPAQKETEKLQNNSPDPAGTGTGLMQADRK